MDLFVLGMLQKFIVMIKTIKSLQKIFVTGKFHNHLKCNAIIYKVWKSNQKNRFILHCF